MSKQKSIMRIVVLCITIALVAACLCVGLVACGDTGEQKGNSSRYAGKYYEVIGTNLSPNSWYELKSDWTWIDNDGETGKFAVDGSTIKIYWLIDEEEAFDGYISSDEIIFYLFGRNATYRKGNPSKPSEPTIPDEPTNPEQHDKFTITFDVNGGDETISPKSYEGGVTLSDLPIPTRDGYTFVSWKGLDGYTYSRTSTMPYYDLRLSAQWEKKVSTFEDDYVYFKPAIQGKKLSGNAYFQYESMGINTYAYVELTSQDLGGRNRVGETNNFDLSRHVNMKYYAKDGYNLNWYVGDFNTPNGAQLFTLNYGSNPQLLTVTQGSRVVRRYLIDIYVKYDYAIKLFSNVYETSQNSQPYATYWVMEGETVPEDINKYNNLSGCTPSEFVYYTKTNELATFKFDTVIYDNWNLYQTYERKEITADLDGGNLNSTLYVKPYTPYQTLPVPTKEGYDFIGWKTPKGNYFTDIVGYSASKYLSSDENFSTLTAEWRVKTYWQYRDGDTVKFISTVPIVTYTGSTQSTICDITYVPSGYYTLPTKTPDNKYFVEWRQYVKNSKTGESVAFNFNNKITSPVALYAKTTEVLGNRVQIPLNGEITVNSSLQSTVYSIYMPYEGKYTLKVTGDATIYVGSYGNNDSATYTATSSSPETITFTATEKGQIVTFNINRSSGRVTFAFNGATGQTTGTLATGGDYVKVGDEVTLTEELNLAYQFLGWYENNVKVSQDDEMSYTFTMPNRNKTLISNRKLYDGLDKLNYTSSDTELKITGVKDKTITTLILPPTVTSIGSSAFANCFKLVEVYNKSSLNITAGGEDNGYVGYYAKAVYTSEYTSKVSTTTDGYILYTDGDVISLIGYIGNETNLTFPSNVTEINQYAFYNSSGFTSITIPDSVTTIGKYAFYDCKGLTSVTIGISVTSIGYRAFENCKKLTTVTIPDSVTSIGGSAFYDCKGLTSVTIGNNVTSIDYLAFSGCYKLVEVCNKSSLNITAGSNGYGYVGYYAKAVYTSEYTSKLSTTEDGYILYIDGDDSFLMGYVGSETDLTLPSNVTRIYQNAFYGCSGLTSITIPASVTSIGGSAFYGCTGLTSITVAQNNPKFHNVNNCLIETASKTLIFGCKTSVIPTDGSVTSIGIGAFYGCSGLTSITIPNSVTSIGGSAFNECSNLTSVTIGNGVTSIGDWAFNECSNLTSVTIGNSVTSIGEYAFSGCWWLKYVYYKGTAKDWAKIDIDNTFNKNDILINATRYYYSEEEPTNSGNYWHYVDGVVTLWTKEN